MKNWNWYLTVGLVVLVSNKLIDYSKIILKWSILVIGICISSYGLYLFFRKKKQN